MSRDRYRIHNPHTAYFSTGTIVAWLPLFTRPEAAQIILDSWRFQTTTGRITLFGYVIMENHVHFITSGLSLEKRVQEFNSYTARKIIEFLQTRGDGEMLGHFERLKLRYKVDSTYQVWQEGSHPIQIESDSMMEQKLEYLHNNPVARGYVDRPEHWRYSSMRNYLGMESLIPVTTDWRG